MKKCKGIGDIFLGLVVTYLEAEKELLLVIDRGPKLQLTTAGNALAAAIIIETVDTELRKQNFLLQIYH